MTAGTKRRKSEPIRKGRKREECGVFFFFLDEGKTTRFAQVSPRGKFANVTRIFFGFPPTEKTFDLEEEEKF